MPLNLYHILNIPEYIVLEPSNNIHHSLSLINDQNKPADNLSHANHAITIVNKFHSYFHFEQSFAYIIAAYIHYLKNDVTSMREYLTKAIFQDHINVQALEFETMITGNIKRDLGYLFSYDKCIKYEKTFLNFAIGKFATLKEIELLDAAIDFVLYFEVLEASKIIDVLDYNSHRLIFAKTLIAIYREELDLAKILIKAAMDSIEDAHKHYHKFASSVYLKRAEIFKVLGKIDLAKNDMVKARDLSPDLSSQSL